MVPNDYLGLPWAPYSLRLVLVAVYFAIASVVLHRRRGLPPGRARLVAAAPIAIFNLLLPSIFHPQREIVTMSVVGLTTMWLSTAKILGWAVGRGPLVLTPLSFPQFAAVAFLPLSPVIPSAGSSRGNARQGETGAGAAAAAADFVVKMMLLAALLAVLQSPSIPRLARELIYALALWLFIAVVMSCVGAVAVAVLGLRCAPHFDAPLLSSSLTDFWSRRWNLNTGYTMRFAVYDPICEGVLIRKEKKEKDAVPQTPPPFTRRATAVCISFIVSGMMHELFIVYMKGRISGYWLAFFAVQGPLLVLEALARQVLRARGMTVPRVIAIPLTLGVLLALGDTLFFPDVVRMGIADNVVQNMYNALVPH